jgi:hypothetical protein
MKISEGYQYLLPRYTMGPDEGNTTPQICVAFSNYRESTILTFREYVISATGPLKPKKK